MPSASHALARAVCDFETYEDYYYHQSIMNCLVTKDDFEYGLNDILDNMKIISSEVPVPI